MTRYCSLALFNGAGREVIIMGFVHKVTAQRGKNSALIWLVYPVVLLLYAV